MQLVPIDPIRSADTITDEPCWHVKPQNPFEWELLHSALVSNAPKVTVHEPTQTCSKIIVGHSENHGWYAWAVTIPGSANFKSAPDHDPLPCSEPGIHSAGKCRIISENGAFIAQFVADEKAQSWARIPTHHTFGYSSAWTWIPRAHAAHPQNA